MRLGSATVFALLGLALTPPPWPPRRRPGSSRRTRSTRARATVASTRPATDTPAGRRAQPGRPAGYGGALSFDGTDDYVGLASLGTFYNTAFTLEAWVQKAERDEERRRRSSARGPAAARCSGSTTSRPRYHLTLGTASSEYLDSGANPVAGPWQHLAATFDGTTARSISTAPRSRHVRSQAASAARTPGGSAPTARPTRLLRRAHRRDPRLRPRLSPGRGRRRPRTSRSRSRPRPTPDHASATSPSPGARRRRSRSPWTAVDGRRRASPATGLRDGAPARHDDGTSFTFTGLACSDGYELEVEAFDGGERPSPRARLTARRRHLWPAPGLARRTLSTRARGRGRRRLRHTGAPARSRRASWSTGRHGSRCSSTASTTTSPWCARHVLQRPASRSRPGCRRAPRRRTSASSAPGQRAARMLWVDHARRRATTSRSATASPLPRLRARPLVGQWQHVAATFDGATARYYVDGVLVAIASVRRAASASSNVWRIGAYGGTPGGFFDGLDRRNVPDHHRALAASPASRWTHESAGRVDRRRPADTAGSARTRLPPTVSITQPASGAVSGPIRHRCHRQRRERLVGRAVPDRRVDLGAEDWRSPSRSPGTRAGNSTARTRSRPSRAIAPGTARRPRPSL